MNDIKEVNLLTKIKDASFITRRLRKTLTYGSIIVSFILIILSIELFIVAKTYEQQAKELVRNSHSVEGEIQKLKDSEAQYRAVSDKLIVAQNIIAKPSRTVLLFDELTTILPPEVTIESLNVSEKDLVVDVSTRSLFSMELFLQNLADPKKGGQFLSGIVASAVGQDTDGRFTASILAKVK